MRYSLFACLLLLLPALGAQDGLQMEPTRMDKYITLDKLESDFRDVTNVVVTNETSRSVKAVARVDRQNAPAAWRFRVYGTRSNRSPYQLSRELTTKGQGMTLKPGQSATFYVELDARRELGNGAATITFTDELTGGALGGSFGLKVSIAERPEATGERPLVRTNKKSRRPPAKTLMLYPNPARERFFVDTPPGIRIGRVDITNALGKRLRRVDGPANEDGYDIYDLPDGLYLITLYDDRGKKLKTMRLLHRRFGA